MSSNQDKIKLSLAIFSIFAYVAAFQFFFYSQNAGMAILAVIPVVTIALLYGWVPGVIAGILTLPVNILLYQLLGIDWYHRMVRHGALIQGTCAIVVFGFALGRMSDLSRRLKKELAEKSIMENELKQHRSNLEKEVHSKTIELQKAYHNLRAAKELLEAQYEQLRASQSELRESRDFLETVINNTTDGIIITSADGLIISFNKPVEIFFGLKKEELIGQPVEIIFLQDPGMKDKGPGVNKEFTENGHATYEMNVKTSDTGLLHLECTTTMIPNTSGAFIASMTILRDVSDRKRMEQQIRQSQKLESIGTLAGGIAHDFNNILAAIIGYTELARDLAGHNMQIGKYLQQVLKASERARNLVKQILAFSRKGEPQRKPILPHLVIREVMKLIRATMPSTIDIHADIPELPYVIIGDTTELHQVIMNLCTNSVHAMQERGGVLRVSLEPVDITPEDAEHHHDIPPGGYVRFCVSDTGTGISPDIINRIFDPFFTTKEIDKGTGMGLAVVHGIVRSYGGDIAVETTPDKGATFSILFPRVQEPGAPETLRQKIIARGSESILLVDDEEPIVTSLEALLASMGYRVTARQDSLEALVEFKKNPGNFDLLITDQTMPHMTGYELSREILAIRPLIPIILCTGFSEKVDASAAKASGIQGFVMKPVSMQELSEAIRSVLDTKQLYVRQTS
jgi:PAS domain S-box-containing protein